jgi:hypothetical protein
VTRRLLDGEQHLGVSALTEQAFEEQRRQARAALSCVDDKRREARRMLDGAEDHRHAQAMQALYVLADARLPYFRIEMENTPVSETFGG